MKIIWSVLHGVTPWRCTRHSCNRMKDAEVAFFTFVLVFAKATTAWDNLPCSDNMLGAYLGCSVVDYVNILFSDLYTGLRDQLVWGIIGRVSLQSSD